MTGLALAGRCWLISPAASGRLPIDLWLRRVLMLTVLLLFPWIVVTVFCRDWKRLVNFFFLVDTADAHRFLSTIKWQMHISLLC